MVRFQLGAEISTASVNDNYWPTTDLGRDSLRGCYLCNAEVCCFKYQSANLLRSNATTVLNSGA